MLFIEAMDEMKKGKKVTRHEWRDKMWFAIEVGSDMPKCFRPKLQAYQYDESIMLSYGWRVDGEDKTYYFPEIITPLIQGKKIHNDNWLKSEDYYLYLDKPQNQLVIRSVESFHHTPNFMDFIANDWRIIE